jgi:hypothetical protein
MAISTTTDVARSFDRLNFIDERLVNKYQPDSQYSKSATKTIDDTLTNQNPMVKRDSVQPAENVKSENIASSITLDGGLKANMISIRGENEELKAILDIIV